MTISSAGSRRYTVPPSIMWYSVPPGTYSVVHVPLRIVWYNVAERYRETHLILCIESTGGVEVEGVLQFVLPGGRVERETD